MLTVVMLGAPGAGKGTQAALLHQRYTIPHISTGDIFRQNLADDTTLGQTAREFMSKGLLVPDNVTEAMVEARLHEPDARQGYVLDGFPRNVAQAHALVRMLEQLNQRLQIVLYIRVDHKILIKRLVGRRVCANCGATYHVEFDPPAVVDVCDKCGEKLVQRPDDQLATVETRLSVYEVQTAPLIAFYRAQGLLHEIDGNASVEHVMEAIVLQLEGLDD